MLKLYVVLLLSLVCINAAEEELYDLNIVHFNDFHARFEETNTRSGKCVPSEGECIGGFPRLYTAIWDLKKENPDAVVLNAGDSFQGTLWFNLLGWNVTQYFMNMLPLDAHALGNHEFDNGVEGVVDYLKTIEAPMVVANMDDSLEPTLHGLHNNSIIIERKGQKIGIVGVIVSNTDVLASTGKLKFTDEIKAVKDEADYLASQGVNKIIVLSHCGLEVDRMIAREAGSNIDVIVGGHSHSLLYSGSSPSNETAADVYPVVVNQESGTTVLIVQASANTKYLGDLTVFFDADGKIQRWEGVPYYLDKHFKQDPKILELMEPFKEMVDELGKRVIGTSRVLLSTSGCSSTECNIGNFICDAMVNYLTNEATDNSWTHAAIAITNTGGIRSSISRGVISYEDLIIAQPFGNLVQSFDIKGKYILEALEFSLNRTNNGPFHSNIFLQVSGLRNVYDVSKPVGERVVEATVRCAKCRIPKYFPLEKETVYKVISQSFLADGGDGYSMISNNKMNVEVWRADHVVIEAYIEKETPIMQGTDMRITVLR